MNDHHFDHDERVYQADDSLEHDEEEEQEKTVHEGTNLILHESNSDFDDDDDDDDLDGKHLDFGDEYGDD